MIDDLSEHRQRVGQTEICHFEYVRSEQPCADPPLGSISLCGDFIAQFGR